MSDDDSTRAVWRKSTKSGGDGGNCVEVAPLPNGRVAVRHSARPDAEVIIYSRDEWMAFVEGVRLNEFDF